MDGNIWWDEGRGEVDAFRAFGYLDALRETERAVIVAKRGKSGRDLPVDRKTRRLVEEDNKTLVVKGLPGRVHEGQVRKLFHELGTGMRFEEWVAEGLAREELGAKRDEEDTEDELISENITMVDVIREHGSCLGWAFVQFRTNRHAANAMMRAQATGGRRLLPRGESDPFKEMRPEDDAVVQIEWAIARTEVPIADYQIFVGNIHPKLDEEQVLHRLRLLLNSPPPEVDDEQLAAGAKILVSEGKEEQRERLPADCLRNVRIFYESSTGKSLGFGFLLVRDDMVERVLSRYHRAFVAAYGEVRKRFTDKHWPPCNPCLPPVADFATTTNAWRWFGVPPVEVVDLPRRPVNVMTVTTAFVPNIHKEIEANALCVFMRRTYEGTAAARRDLESSDMTTLFFGSLPTSVSERELWNLMEPFGKVLALKFSRNSKMCFVNFGYSFSALAALSYLNGTTFHGQMLQIKYGATRFTIPKHIREELGIELFAEQQEEKFSVTGLEAMEPREDLQPDSDSESK